MFGLMRHTARLPYCGTCKTLGVRYGQRSRVLLNHDMVFLAELLMHQAGEPEWSAPYRSFNCLSMPQEIPAILDYAAAVTVVLAHYRIADHCQDSGRWHWRAAARMLSPSFRKASAELRRRGFPLDQLESILSTQGDREANSKSLADVAEPTAIATAMVFSHGAADLYQTGYRFGYLIYVLDAFEDRARDAREGTFNALARFLEVDGRRDILRTVDEIELPPALHARLRANVEERLGMRPRVLCCVSRKTLSERWRDAVAFARAMRDREKIGVAVFAAVAVVAMVFPHHVRGAISSQECVTVPFNLMALGTFFATPASKPKSKCGCADNCGSCCDCGECCGGCCECCSC